jgi:hypothetical protein
MLKFLTTTAAAFAIATTCAANAADDEQIMGAAVTTLYWGKCDRTALPKQYLEFTVDFISQNKSRVAATIDDLYERLRAAAPNVSESTRIEFWCKLMKPRVEKLAAEYNSAMKPGF